MSYNLTRIIASNLTKEFRTQRGVDELNFDIEFSGLGLLGPNGSGKTTFIKLLLGIISPTFGEVRVNVEMKDIRVVSDQPSLPDKMTIDEYVYTLEKIYGDSLHGIDIQTDFSLEGQWRLGDLSAGQRRKVALLPAFYGTPKLIILDEPSNYLDITTREYVLTLLKRQCQITKASIIISTHRTDEIRLFADNVILLKQGKLANHVKLHDQQPDLYSIKPNDVDKLANIFNKSNIDFHQTQTIQGNIINAPPSPKMFAALEEFTGNGGSILSFKVVDVLERMIEELTK